MSEEYPIFSGKVIKVGPIVKDGTETWTTVQYLEGLDDVNNKDIAMGLFPFLKERDPNYVPLEDRVKTAVIPMHIDPSVLHFAEVRARFSKFKSEDGDIKCYEVEIIESPPGHAGAFNGLRYVKKLEGE